LHQGNFSINPGSDWIPFGDVVREPALSKMLRLEVIEYVKIQQNEKLQGLSEYDPFRIDTDAVKKSVEAGEFWESRQSLSCGVLATLVRWNFMFYS
jgi:hypothetical protein